MDISKKNHPLRGIIKNSLPCGTGSLSDNPSTIAQGKKCQNKSKCLILKATHRASERPVAAVQVGNAADEAQVPRIETIYGT